ncbi:MAG: RHS repeat-associated core domain-containing protein [Saprospiraceae bacterium]|nr:RHS repeat-associated core domain-containing protein [Saprospiraceae bacterium]
MGKNAVGHFKIKVAGWATPYTFTGKEKDDLTGLQYFGARYYDSRISIWYGVDPMAEEMPEYSSYCYTFDNPIRFIDPDGMVPTPLIGFIIGFGLDVASQMVFEGKSLKDVNYKTATVSGFAGALSGGVSSIAKFGKVGQVVAGAVIDAGESTSKQLIIDGKVDGTQLASDVLMGGIGGQAKGFGEGNIKVKENTLDRTQRIARNDPASSGRAANVSKAKNSLETAKNVNLAVGTQVGNTLQSGSDKVRSAINTGSGTSVIINKPVQIVQDNTRVVKPLILRNEQ